MKFGRISSESPDGKVARLVAVEPEKDRVIDLARACALYFESERHATPEAARRMAVAAFPGSMADAISTGSHLKDFAHDVVSSRGDDASQDIGDVDWLPASDPPVLRDTINFEEHLKGWSSRMGVDLPDAFLRIPGYCQNSPAMVIGHNATVEWPGYIDYMDYELELGWVIGRRCKNLRPENALDSLFGVTLYNDFSGRNVQKDEVAIGMGGTKAKNFGHAIGPWITTMDEIEDIYNISMEVRLNGETKGKGKSTGLVWPLNEQLSYISLGENLSPGEVIGSGTLGGGSLFELGEKLSPGDVVELEAGGIGTLRNVMGEKVEGLWWPTPRGPIK